MRAPEDLHPDDRDVRIGLRDALVERRQRLGLSQHRLAERLGVAQATVAYLENRETWRLASVQRWARGLRWRLVLRLENLPGADDEPATVFRPTDPDRADLWDQAAIVEQMSAARAALGVTKTELGRRLGTNEQAVAHVERLDNGPGLMFITPQRHCRALGGALWVGTESLVAEGRAAA